ncbi:RING1 and YY1-binding protein B [Silurus meridionalis]|nr:RING1 and YY1-binding protein B [Silurus meridionalis]
MGDKKSPTRPKRQAKPAADDGYWDCSVCTFRNSAEAFKCSICDVRKGTSTRFLLHQVHGVKLHIFPCAGGIRNLLAKGEHAITIFTRNPAAKVRGRQSRHFFSPQLVTLARCGTDIQGKVYVHVQLVEGEYRYPATKPRINSQLVAQQVAQQYATPPPAKKEKKEKPERLEKEKADGERPERNLPDGELPAKEKIENDHADKEKKDREKEITVSLPKKPSKKTRPKMDNHQSPPSERNSIQSGKSTTKTKNSHISSRPKLKNVDRSTAQQLAITVGNVTVIITDFKEKTRSSSTSSSTVTSSAASEQQHPSSGSESIDKSSSRASTPKRDLSLGHDESF